MDPRCRTNKQTGPNLHSPDLVRVLLSLLGEIGHAGFLFLCSGDLEFPCILEIPENACQSRPGCVCLVNARVQRVQPTPTLCKPDLGLIVLVFRASQGRVKGGEVWSPLIQEDRKRRDCFHLHRSLLSQIAGLKADKGEDLAHLSGYHQVMSAKRRWQGQREVREVTRSRVLPGAGVIVGNQVLGLFLHLEVHNGHSVQLVNGNWIPLKGRQASREKDPQHLVNLLEHRY